MYDDLIAVFICLFVLFRVCEFVCVHVHFCYKGVQMVVNLRRPQGLMCVSLLAEL